VLRHVDKNFQRLVSGERQRASGEVLAAISSTIADTAPVFGKIVESCERLFSGRLVQMNLDENRQKQLVEEYLSKLPKETRV